MKTVAALGCGLEILLCSLFYRRFCNVVACLKRREQKTHKRDNVAHAKALIFCVPTDEKNLWEIIYENSVVLMYMRAVIERSRSFLP